MGRKGRDFGHVSFFQTMLSYSTTYVFFRAEIFIPLPSSSEALQITAVQLCRLSPKLKNPYLIEHFVMPRTVVPMPQRVPQPVESAPLSFSLIFVPFGMGLLHVGGIYDSLLLGSFEELQVVAPTVIGAFADACALFCGLFNETQICQIL